MPNLRALAFNKEEGFMSSRQQRRKEEREKSKKIGQLLAIKDELKKPSMRIRQYVANRKNLIRLEGDLMELGVIRKPTRWEKFVGRLKSTFRFKRHLKVVR